MVPYYGAHMMIIQTIHLNLMTNTPMQCDDDDPNMVPHFMINISKIIDHIVGRTPIELKNGDML